MKTRNLNRRDVLVLGGAAALIGTVASPFGQIKPAFAAPKTGVTAPDFSIADSNGKMHNLKDYEGKTVILEWTNHECPFVMKHYGTENMQKLQRDATADGIVWLSVVSSAPGTQGYVDGDEANNVVTEQKAAPTAVLLDPKGKLGRTYSARVTPHMYIIDASGTLVYMGGIDDTPTANWDDVKTANNYVRAALDDMKNGRAIQNAVTRPYGCTVKYDTSA